MFWILILGCSCQGDRQADFVPKSRPGLDEIQHDPERLKQYPKCVEYAETLCRVCGEKTEACQAVRRVNDVCSARGSCQEDRCAGGTVLVRDDPKGSQSEICTE